MLKYIAPRKVSSVIKYEQLHILRNNKKSVLIASVFMSIVTTAILWPVVDHTLILLWMLASAGFALVRITIPYIFTKKKSIKEWAKTHLLCTAITGVIWGTLALFFDPTWSADYQVMFLVIFVGLVFAALTSNVSVLSAFLAFVVPVLCCLIAVLFSQPVEGYTKIAYLALALGAVAYETAVRYHNQIADYLEMRSVNNELTNNVINNSLELKAQAEIDELTKIANRRTMDKYLQSQWSRHRRNQQPLAFIFIDIDFFKLYNDTYGHQEGDRCLATIAGILAENARRTADLAARYGGEEFAIILPETNGEQAMVVAERVREHILSKQLPHMRSLVADYVTASIGVASMVPDIDQNADVICMRADNALYMAKQQGRNQCLLWQQNMQMNKPGEMMKLAWSS